MAMQMRTFKRKTLTNNRTWHGSAFIIEALALLLFLAICMAILMQLLSFSYHRVEDANRISNAVLLASNEAESFAASPTTVKGKSYYALVNGVLQPISNEQADCYVVSNSVKSTVSSSGTMYDDTIVVSNDGETLYELSTSNYRSQGGMS